jgi:hypothetical protein
MQRQSLGSPVSKLHGHGGGAKDDTLIMEEPKHRDDDSYCDDDVEHKATKPHRLSVSPPPRPEKFVHVIPVLTLFCFLVLYLCSHTPSQSGTYLLTINGQPHHCFRFSPLSYPHRSFCSRFGSVQWISPTSEAHRYNADSDFDFF